MTNGIVYYVLQHDGEIMYINAPTDDGRDVGNCSIAKYNNNLYVSGRINNYTFIPTDEEDYHFPQSKSNKFRYVTQNKLLIFDTENKTFNVIKDNFLPPPEPTNDNLPPRIGYEDIKLTEWNKTLYATCSVPHVFGDQRIPTAIVEFDGLYEHISIQRYNVNDIERNWMPVSDKPFHFVYSINPTQIATVGKNGVTCKKYHKTQLISTYKGSSQAIPYNDGHIAIVHSNVWEKQHYTYKHHIIEWDEEWNVKRISKAFSFSGLPREFCCGLCIDNDKVYITFSLFDNMAFLLVTNIDTIEDILNGEYHKEQTKKKADNTIEEMFLSDDRNVTINVINEIANTYKNIGGAIPLATWFKDNELAKKLLKEYMPDCKALQPIRKKVKL